MTFLSLVLTLVACDKPIAETGDAAVDTDTGVTVPIDADEDGYDVDDDCDDGNSAVFPGAEELCNGEDDNCNGVADEGFSDVDGDAISDCVDVEDCDALDNDGDGSIDEDFADNDSDGLPDCLDSEDCDGTDNDGDGLIDEGYDLDGDGYLPCGAEDADPSTLDCDDSDGSVSPGASEIDETLADEDCDGLVDEGMWAEGDLVITELMINPELSSDPNGEWIELLNVSDRTLYLDGLRLVTTTGEHAVASDSLVALEPGGYALLASNGDRNANGGLIPDYAYEALISLTNESGGLSIYAGGVLLDEVFWDDGETFPDASGASASLDPDFLNISDNDQGGLWCPGEEPWSVGTDRGSPGSLNPPCGSLDRDNDGYSPEDGDCDDNDDIVGPHMDEIEYDGVDNDCDPLTYDDDLDQDGYDEADDCDDRDDGVNPGAAEICDPADVDEDCNGRSEDDDLGVTGTTRWYLDDDGDTYGDDDVYIDACESPIGYLAASGDCDDTDPTYNPGAIEDDCEDPNDYNCDGLVGTIDEDNDGFLNCQDDCDDSNNTVYPYAFEDTTDGVDNDCDGFIDGADPDAVTSVSLSDDSTSLLNFSSFSFDFCGTTYSSVYVSSNGRLTFGFSDTSYSESATTMNSARSVAGLWDDLNPSSGGTVYWIEHDDAVGVYFRDVYEYGTSNPNTFSMILLDDGRVLLTYENISPTDGLAGWSCGSGAAGASEVDLTAEVDSIPEGSVGIGEGTETGVYEVFVGGSANDLDNETLMFCVNSGTDSDGDGWTDECGDPNDFDASITP